MGVCVSRPLTVFCPELVVAYSSCPSHTATMCSDQHVLLKASVESGCIEMNASFSGFF